MIGPSVVLLGFLGGSGALSQDLEAEVEALPPLPPGPERTAVADWLVRTPAVEATLWRDEEQGTVVLGNGLVERTFRIGPGLGTVALDHRVTDQSLLRAVRPEARVVLEGVACDVGGLIGQKNHAYLRQAGWSELSVDPEAFVLSGLRVGEPEARFPWARKRPSEGRPWPPPGKRVVFEFVPGVGALERFRAAGPSASDDDRELLIVDEFDALDPRWSIHRSDADERTSFQNEGKVAEIYAPANTCVCAEAPLPAGAEVIELEVDVGTDPAKSWGPGVAVDLGTRWIKLALRAGDRRYGAHDGVREHLLAEFDPAVPQRLRLRVEAREIVLEAASPQEPLRTLAALPLREGEAPRRVRVGKTDLAGGLDDFSQPGEWGRCRLERLRVFGGLRPEALRDRDRLASALSRVRVEVHYELYDGIPVLSKWITVHNDGDRPVRLERFHCEILAAVERQSRVEHRGVPMPPPNIHVETDMAFGGMAHENANRHTVHWGPDPQYSTQVNYLRRTPCLLEVGPDVGPDQEIEPGRSFESCRAFLLLHDSEERERRGLALRRMYRTIAPWVTENPLMMHVRHSDPESVRRAIDQCAEVGFEMVILTFGSGFDIEDESPENLQRWKEMADHAESRGIELGGYSLLSSRRIRPDSDNIVNPQTGKPGGQTHGFCPALASEWGQRYFQTLVRFFEQTGFDLLEHDGSYPGDVDAAARPPLQRGASDSQWVQWRIIADYYQWCRARGIYLNVPDYYYLAGANKCGMGYRETNWSLPRDQQLIHARQNIYDGTWQKTPSMGWMFVPLTQYHGGGAAATVEPLDEHLETYEMHMANCLGAGVQACYRGPRLYDTERTKAAVTRWVAWFKEHRAILESDLIHGRRADGRDLDWILHVNPALEERAMLCVYNPLDEARAKTITVPLYYAGLDLEAVAVDAAGRRRELELDRRWEVALDVEVPANSMRWWVFRER